MNINVLIPVEVMENLKQNMRTTQLIEMLADEEIKSGKEWTSAEIVRAFTETNSLVFSRADIDFIKASKQSESLQALFEAVKTLAKDKQVKRAVAIHKEYEALREEIKSHFDGRIFYI